ncbi:MAG: amidohydrolase [Proteobacteria bacterium]|nr:amidohydrolase [Pseudomonadota bacterium]
MRTATLSWTAACLLVLCSRCFGADVILFNARIFTAEPDRPYADAIAIRDDRIVAVGALKTVETQVGPGAKRVDLERRFLMPGMIDAHAHPMDGGAALLAPRYSATDGSVPNLVKFVESKLDDQAAHRGDVLVVSDIDLGLWSHVAAIDAALSTGKFGKQRIVLVGSDGHTSWANRPTRIKAGITPAFVRKLSEVEQRSYGHDAQGNPNGFVLDAGQDKVEKSLPRVPMEAKIAAGRAALEYMHSIGITGWLDAAPAGVVGGAIPLSEKDPGWLPVYATLGKQGELTAHVVGYPVISPELGNAQIDVVQHLQSQFQGIPNFRIPGLKIFADGVVETPSQNASLTKPYAGGRDVKPLFTPAKANELVAEAYRRGLTVHIHAIGDLAVKDSLDAFEAARRANPQTKLPFVLTHAQFVDPEDIPRFSQLHVIAALQLLWALADSSTNEIVKPYIDPEIYRWMYPARSLLDSGAVIAGASDWPVSSANPFLAIYQALTRRGEQGVLDETQRMPREAMLYAYTRNAAQVLDMSDQIGTLAPGKLADLVLVDRDVLTVPAEELKQAKVLWTVFGGKAVFGNPPF